jgi:hypothetical protein
MLLVLIKMPITIGPFRTTTHAPTRLVKSLLSFHRHPLPTVYPSATFNATHIEMQGISGVLS